MAETEGTEGAGVTACEGSMTGAGTSLADMEEMTGWAGGIKRAVAQAGAVTRVTGTELSAGSTVRVQCEDPHPVDWGAETVREHQLAVMEVNDVEST